MDFFKRFIPLFLILFKFTSCSQVAYRAPSSIFPCQEVFRSRLAAQRTPVDEIVEHFYLKNPNVTGHVNYHINFDRVERYVLGLPEKYPNQLTVSAIGSYDGKTLQRIDIPGWGQGPKKKVIITAGVHGNESAGVGTVINVLDSIMFNPAIRNHYDIVIVPYMNPRGLTDNLRRLGNNVDMNRTFPGGKEAQQKITKMLRENLKGERFDLGLDLHEAPFRDKFFIIKMNEDDHGLTRSVLKDVPEEYLVTDPKGNYPGSMYKSAAPGKPQYAHVPANEVYTLYGPGEVSSSNRGTVKGFFADDLGVEHSYTLEAPGQFDLTEKIGVYSGILERYLDEFLLLGK